MLRRHVEFANAHPEVPWRRAYETRNAVSHGYFDVDLITIWTTIRDDLPALERQLTALLSAIPDEPARAAPPRSGRSRTTLAFHAAGVECVTPTKPAAARPFPLFRIQRLIGANGAGVISLLRCLMTQPASAFFAR